MREETPDNEAAETPDPDAGLTRAERRAKGKKGGQAQQAHGKQHFVPKNSQGQAQRIWSNRRAG
ncbi:MAG: hypothetical protein HOV77_24910 [Hamadaea sp.]|uniref:hypothetical protein n=1 Tax=Hamadaea sp. TaxID=2024425 RepID=UPI00182D0CF0|nr:hypothetical protein [Hamadaea sp.]NUT22426.1 hypothetical protein [Hamadaea sp.]